MYLRTQCKVFASSTPSLVEFMLYMVSLYKSSCIDCVLWFVILCLCLFCFNFLLCFWLCVYFLFIFFLVFAFVLFVCWFFFLTFLFFVFFFRLFLFISFTLLLYSTYLYVIDYVYILLCNFFISLQIEYVKMYWLNLNRKKFLMWKKPIENIHL